MKSRFFLAAFLAATIFAVTQSGKLYAKPVNLADDEVIVDCDPSPTTICATIAGSTYYGKYRKP